MSISAGDLFDPTALSALRGIRRDRRLIVAVGARRLTDVDEASGRPDHVAVCLDFEASEVLTVFPVAEGDIEEAVVGVLLDGILDPDDGREPRLPRRVIVEDQSIARAIQGPMRRLGVDVVVQHVEALDSVARALSELSSIIAELPRWMRDAPAGLPLHQAAAFLWAAAPWDRLPDDRASATIALGAPVTRRIHVLAMDFDDLTSIMFLFNDADFNRMADQLDSDSEEGESPLSFTGVAGMGSFDMILLVFVNAHSDVLGDANDVDMFEDMRWPVGGGEAYPRFVRPDGSATPSPLTDDDAETLTLAMEALARFCMSEDVLRGQESGAARARVRIRHGDDLIDATVSSPAEA